MRAAAKIFYLAVFGFMSLAGADQQYHSYDTCAVGYPISPPR